MSDRIYTCGSGLFSSCLADTMSAFVEYKVNVGGCVPESFLPVLKRFDRYLTGLPEPNARLDADTVLGFMESQDVKNSTAARQPGRPASCVRLGSTCRPCRGFPIYTWSPG